MYVRTKNKTGWFDYNDTATAITPIAFTVGTPAKLTNNGLGAQTLKLFKPVGVGEIWNTTTNQLNFTDLSVGDEVVIRFEVTVETLINNQEFRFYLDMAQGSVANYQLNDGYSAFKTASQYPFGFNMRFYIGNAETRDNPAEIMFNSDGNAKITVHGFYITILKK